MRLLHVALALTLALFSAVTFAEAININTATVEELTKGVHGLGPAKAAAIVKYREAHGPFQSVDDLTKVKGIKQKALDSLLADKRNQITAGEAAAAPAAPAASTTPAAPATAPTAPAVPATPAAPAVPAKAPTAPAVPATPAAPAMPTAPAVPAAPATTPTAPATPPAMPAAPTAPPKP